MSDNIVFGEHQSKHGFSDHMEKAAHEDNKKEMVGLRLKVSAQAQTIAELETENRKLKETKLIYGRQLEDFARGQLQVPDFEKHVVNNSKFTLRRVDELLNNKPDGTNE